MLTLFFLIDIITLALFSRPATLFLIGAYSSLLVARQKAVPTAYALVLLSILIPVIQQQPYRYCACVAVSIIAAFFVKRAVYTTPLIHAYATVGILFLYLFCIEHQALNSISEWALLSFRVITGCYSSWLCTRQQSMLYL